MAPNSTIFGCEGPVLTDWEADFFTAVDPVGFILFARNCRDPAQVRDLVAALRRTVGRADAPVLIDQEGGRVARLRPPHWRAAPPPARFGGLAELDRARACEAARLNARLLAADLAALGITVDCAPVLDLADPGGHDAIGDRAFAHSPNLVAALGRAFCQGMMQGGVIPVVKHVPGQGRAAVDSHHALPVVTAGRVELAASDFQPFIAMADAPWAMTAHVVYSAVDPEHPATLSRLVIEQVIRGDIGFAGVLVTDDLSMGALAGGFAERTAAALEAGCDLVLHCNGRREEMAEVARGAGPISPETQRRLAAAATRPDRVPAPAADPAPLRTRLDELLGAA